MQDKLVSIKKAADYCGVHVETIKNWTKLRLIDGVRTAGGHRRYSLSHLAEKMREWSGNFNYEI